MSWRRHGTSCSTPPLAFSPNAASTTSRLRKLSERPVSGIRRPSTITSEAATRCSELCWLDTSLNWQNAVPYCSSMLVLDRLATSRSAAEAIVRPVTEFAQGGWRQRAYLQIGSELAGAVDRVNPEVRDLLKLTAGHAAWELLCQRCPTIPKDLWITRQEICIVFIGRAAADRARQLDQGGRRRVLSDDRFVENLVEMLLGAMKAPHRDS